MKHQYNKPTLVIPFGATFMYGGESYIICGLTFMNSLDIPVYYGKKSNGEVASFDGAYLEANLGSDIPQWSIIDEIPMISYDEILECRTHISSDKSTDGVDDNVLKNYSIYMISDDYLDKFKKSNNPKYEAVLAKIRAKSDKSSDELDEVYIRLYHIESYGYYLDIYNNAHIQLPGCLKVVFYSGNDVLDIVMQKIIPKPFWRRVIPTIRYGKEHPSNYIIESEDDFLARVNDTASNIVKRHDIILSGTYNLLA